MRKFRKNENSLYLRQNVQIEPLVDQWYAWSHLISPATAAMNIQKRHLPIMESYVKAPMLHAAAVQNPAMLGGPFMDYPEQSVARVQALIDKTRRERGHMLELAQALRDLDKLLVQEARGYSLEPLYEKIPAPLKGYVELVYDLKNYPSFRLFESLLYRSRWYNLSSQSLHFSLIHGDDRPFILSTPRLTSDEGLQLNRPFNHPGIDTMFKMKTTPQRLDEVVDVLELEDVYIDPLTEFLTTERPPAYTPYEGKMIRWRYYGHACVLIESPDVNILLDPVLSYTYESNISRYTYLDLPDVIDYVLITHNHQDHILFETMLQLRHKIRHVIVPRCSRGTLQDPSLKLMMQHVGFSNVIEIDEMESIPLDNGEIMGLPFLGEHADLDIPSKLGYMVRLGRHSLAFLADSCNVEPMLYRHVQQCIGAIDVLFIGMECDGAPLSWLYGPLLTQPLGYDMDQSRRLSGSNFERAYDLIDRFHCHEVYVYAMGQEPWLNFVMSKKYTADSDPIIQSNHLLEACARRGIVAERLFGEKEILLDL